MDSSYHYTFDSEPLNGDLDISELDILDLELPELNFEIPELEGADGLTEQPRRLQEVIGDDRQEDVQLEVSLGGGKADCGKFPFSVPLATSAAACSMAAHFVSVFFSGLSA